MTDVLGGELNVGDIVLFSTKHGQTAWLKLSIICKIKDGYEYGGRKYQTASIMSGDLYGTNGGEAKVHISAYTNQKTKGYPQLGNGADGQKMFKLCHFDSPGEYKTVALPLILAYNRYQEEQKQNEAKLNNSRGSDR